MNDHSARQSYSARPARIETEKIDRQPAAETAEPLEGAASATWDFSATPLSPEDNTGRGYQLRPLAALPALGPEDKIFVGLANDPLEREADHIAEGATGPTQCTPDADGARPQPPQRKGLRTTEEDLLGQLSGLPSGREAAAPDIVRQVLRSPAPRLDAANRATFEPQFGFDFSRVLVHSDSKAGQSARAIGARAYTFGQHIVLGDASERSRSVLAHELAHVVQHSAEAGATGLNHPRVRRVPGPGSDPPQTGSGNFTPAQATLLQQARANLKTGPSHIVGVLITDDGRQFDLESGGGQGFSSHIEGKATKKMAELGIKRATLLSELEPCQLCDRSNYPAQEGPAAPLRSTKTGGELSRQTPKISSALPIGSELTVVDPHSTSVYRGTQSSAAPSAPKSPATAPRGVAIPPHGSEEDLSGAASLPARTVPSALKGDAPHEPTAQAPSETAVPIPPVITPKGGPSLGSTAEGETQPELGTAPKTAPPNLSAPPSESLQGLGGAVAVEAVFAIVDLAVRIWMQNHYAKELQEYAKTKIHDQLISEKARLDAAVKARQADIASWKTQGQAANLVIELELDWQGTDIGAILMNVRIPRIAVAKEGDPGLSPRPQDTTIAGFFKELLHNMLNSSIRFEIIHIRL